MENNSSIKVLLSLLGSTLSTAGIAISSVTTLYFINFISKRTIKGLEYIPVLLGRYSVVDNPNTVNSKRKMTDDLYKSGKSICIFTLSYGLGLGTRYLGYYVSSDHFTSRLELLIFSLKK